MIFLENLSSISIAREVDLGVEIGATNEKMAKNVFRGCRACEAVRCVKGKISRHNSEPLDCLACSRYVPPAVMDRRDS